MGDQKNTRDAAITFPCGAVYECNYNIWQPKESGKGKRIRLMVLDTASPEKPKPPKHLDGEAASCLWCPTRKHRREQLLMHDGPDPFARRVGVMCSGVLTRKEVPRG